jgi:hypothetical protein
MAEQPGTPDDAADAPAAPQNGSARRGGEAKGGTAPRPGDIASPAQAEKDAAQRKKNMEQGGFGDHKGGRI